MHVLITADAVGGVWTYVRELVTGLVRHDVRVTLVTFGRIPTAEQTEWMEGLGELDFRPTGFRLEWMQHAENDVELSADYLLSVVRETRPDLIHFNQYCYGALEVDVPKVVVAHSDVVSWWVAVNGEEPGDTPWSRWYREVVSRGLDGATAVVAPSQWMLNAIRSYYLRPDLGKVIYNGRTPTLFNGDISKEDYVVSVGRLWDQGKQVSLLTRMNPPLPVYIVGPDRHPDDTLSAPVPPASRGRLVFRGQMAEAGLRLLYARAAMYAATSQYEPFGLAPLEAALSRCALIVNDIASFRELWGESACYFRHNDPRSLEQTLQRLACDRDLRIHYANLAYQHAREKFTAARMVDEYCSLYQSLVPVEVESA